MQNNNKNKELFKTLIFQESNSTCTLLNKLDETAFKLFNHGFNSMEDLAAYLKNNNMDINSLYYDNNSFILHTCYYFEKEYIFVPIFGGLSQQAMDFIKLPKYIEQLRNKMQGFLDNKQYKKFYSFIEKKIKVHYFTNHYQEIPKDEQLEIFEKVYSSVEDGFETLLSEEIFNEILLPNKGKKTLDFFLNETQAEVLKDTNEIIVYRGEGDLSTYYEDGALSWTLDKKIAKFFAKRFDSQYPTLFQAKVKISDILTYISKESEVLVESMDLIDVEEIDI